MFAEPTGATLAVQTKRPLPLRTFRGGGRPARAGAVRSRQAPPRPPAPSFAQRWAGFSAPSRAATARTVPACWAEPAPLLRTPRMAPTEPTDRIEPVEPIDRIEPAEPKDRIEPAENAEPADSTEPSDAAENAEPMQHHEANERRDREDRAGGATARTLAAAGGRARPQPSPSA